MPEPTECHHWTIGFDSKCVDCGKQFAAIPLDEFTAARLKKAFGPTRRFKIIN